MSTRLHRIATSQPMTIEQALAWAEEATGEARALRMRRWNEEYPVGHRERDDHRPKFVQRKRR